MTRRRRLLALVSLAPYVSACYATVRVDPTHVTPGTRVAITLNAPGAAEMAPALGPDVARAEGELRGWSPRGVELSLLRTERRDGVDALWQRQPIVFPRDAVAGVARRRLDRRRTWLLTGGLALAAGLLAHGFAAAGQQPVGAEPGPVGAQ